MNPGTIILAVLAGLVLIWALREVNAWYWKINETLNKLTAIQEEIHLLRTGSPDIKQPSKNWVCPQCRYENPNTVFKCEMCQYALT